MKVLVTGGAGYIGSHTCKALAGAGFEPVCIDNLSRGHRWAVQWGPFEHCDVEDTARLKKIIDRYSPVGAIHFAAYAYVGESSQNPLLYYRNNVGGTVSLLTALRDAGNLPIVFSSTCAVYGLPEHVPIQETAPRCPISPYGMSKYMVERILEDSASATDMPYMALRYFNAAGADAACEIGEAHDPETHLIPLALKAARAHSEPLSIFGADYPTPDGTAVRDYIHVSDLAQAHVLALKYLLDGGQSKFLNLGTGSGYSVREILDSVRRVTGNDVPVIVTDRRPGDPPILVANPDEAKKALNFKAKYSEDIDTIIGTAWAWMNSEQGAKVLAH